MINCVRFVVTDEALYVANTGRPIDRLGVISIARQYLSTKGESPPIDNFDVADRSLPDAVRRRVLAHYRNDANDLKEHADQERQTREDYTGRCLWELLQNADDAMAPAGRPSSELIGAKGLGFKSVLEISERPEIHSGPFRFAFDPDRSAVLLRAFVEDPPRLVFRLPHPAKADVVVSQLRAERFTTVVKLPFKDAQSRVTVEARLRDLPAHFLLLSQHLRVFEARFPDGGVRRLTREGGGQNVDAAKATLRIADGEATREETWRMWSRVWPAAGEAEKRHSAAIAVRVEGKTAVPADYHLPVHVFFPTQEPVLIPFLIHGSFKLRTDRNHFAPGEQGEALLKVLGELAKAVAAYLTPASVLELFRDLAKPPAANAKRLEKRLQRALALAVAETAFVPLFGGGRAPPGAARTWAHDAIDVLNPRATKVRAAQLAAAELKDSFGLLRTFGADPLTANDYADLLANARCHDHDSCRHAARVAHDACLASGSLSATGLQALARAPFWLTVDGSVRALSMSRPLTRTRPAAWPGWLAADELDAGFAREVLGTGTATDAAWVRLVKDRLLQSTDDLIVHALAPTLRHWDAKAWAAHGWDALTTIQAWRPDLEFTKIRPFVDGLASDPDPARTALVKVARVPRGGEWVPAVDAYASVEINGNPGLADYFRRQPDRPVVGHPPKGRVFGRAGWRALLRYLGVSWEPKVRRSTTWAPDGVTCFYRYWAAVEEGGLNTRQQDWHLDHFPECVAEVGGLTMARMLESLLPVTSQLTAAYLKRSDAYRTHRPRPFASFADYQLRREAYLPCRPSLGHPQARGAARDLYWPGRGLRGITPVLDLGTLQGAQQQRLRPQFIRHLGLCEELPNDWGPWLGWADELAQVVAGGETIVPERVVRHFYEEFLHRPFQTPRPRSVKRLVCLTATGLQAVPAAQALWIDAPAFAAPDIQAALIQGGHALFPAMLDRGERSVARLGARRASEVIKVSASALEASERQTARLTKRLQLRRRALAALCDAKGERWVDPPAIRAVRNLSLTLTAEGTPVGARTAPAFRDASGWRVNLDAGDWAGLAVACAEPFRQAADLRHWFLALLSAATSRDAIAVLMDGGIPAYRLREIALPDDEPDEDEDTSAPPSARPAPPAEAAAASPAGSGALDATGEETDEEDEGDDPETADETPVDGNSRAGSSRGASAVSGRDARPPGTSRAPTGQLRKRPLYNNTPGDSEGRTGRDGRAAAAEAAAAAAARGFAAEAWFAGQLRETLRAGWYPTLNVRDDLLRESDIVLTAPDGDEWHFEIKSLTTERIYWSQLEQTKAVDLPGRYAMVFLVPDASGGFRIHWSWDPLHDLLACERRVDWVWSSTDQGPALAADSWEPLQGLKHPQRPPNRLNFAIQVTDAFLSTRPGDNRALAVMWARVEAASLAASRAPDTAPTAAG